MINPFLIEKLPDVQHLFNEYKINRAYAFGSVVTEKFSDTSDIDLLVSFENEPDPLVRGERWWDLYFKLQELFKRNVDLVTEEQLKNPYLIESINANKILIYGK
jgi:uncharacterized protein